MFFFTTRCYNCENNCKEHQNTKSNIKPHYSPPNKIVAVITNTIQNKTPYKNIILNCCRVTIGPRIIIAKIKLAELYSVLASSFLCFLLNFINFIMSEYKISVKGVKWFSFISFLFIF